MKKFILFITLMTSVSFFAQDVLMQNGTINQCSGTFYDSGGAAGNYGSNENFILTICPDSPGQFMQFDFTLWNTQLNADIMTIYNGPDTASPAFGQYSGGATGSPGLVVATQANASGCITFEFTSDAAATTTGWAADISCFEPCQTIVSQLDSATPAPNGDGYIRVCPDEQITLEGSGQFSTSGAGATYEWDLGDGNFLPGQTATFSYPNPGVYIVNLNITDTNPLGCSNTNLINQVIQVGTEPDFTGTAAADPTICFGDITTIDGVVAPVEFINDCTPPVSGTTFLPDGSGASYSTCITVDCYESSQTLDDISQLIEICLNMEHSYLGDLDIFITSPNGQQVTLKSFGAGGGGTYLGGANDDNSTDPGIGADYCFAMSGTVILVNGPTIIAGSNPPGNSIAPGTYLPEESFVSLLGSPLNGDWCIEVVDNLGIDNGYIFSWGMNFDPSIQPPELSFTPVITSELWDPDPSITNTTGNTITVAPPTAGTHCFTYRVTDDFGCEYTEQVCIDVLPEVVNDPPNDLFVCDTGVPPYIFDLTQNDGVVLASNPSPGDFVVTYHETQADANNDANAIATAGAYSGTDGQIIYVRIEYLTSDCFETSTFTLNVSGQPLINPVPDMELCDDASNDGFEAFDLEAQSLSVLGAQDPLDFVVLYFTSFADADAGTNALVSPYTNTANPQPIFVRVESVGDSNCYIASPVAVFNLIVNPQASATQPNDLLVCDDASNDGIAQFDLESQTATILGAQSPALYTITYHASQSDADAGINALLSPYTNLSNPQTIYVRVEENLNPTCYGTTTFELIVNPLPVLIDPTPLEVCDDAVADGFTSIDLSVKDDEIRGGNPNYAVTYYLTQADADAGINPLAIPYTNISNPQTIYARGQDINTGCYSTVSLDLVVEQAPIANVPTPLEYCDPDSDGFGVFTLTDADLEITGGVPGLTVSYHETLADAQNNVNALTSPYNNIVVNTQTLYARVESATITTDCYTIVDLVLIVNPEPQITLALDALEQCDDNTDGFTQFDLTQAATQVLNGIDPALVTISYYETQANAEAATNAIAVPASYTNIINPQTVWIRVEYDATGCYKVTTLELIVNGLPVLTQPSPLELCDVNNPGDEMESFSLEDSISEILNGQSGMSITFYETQADADAGTNALVSPYTNLSNPQTIYARAENDMTGCVSTITLDLRVNPIPTPAVPTPLEVCDDDNDGFASFDLDSRTLEIINGELDISITYHETQADAQSGQNVLLSPYDNIVPDNQTVYARAENGITGCFTIVGLDLIVLPSPEVPLAMDDYVICDDDNDGFAGFDLTLMDVVILGSQDPLSLTLTYHLTQADADTGNNPIVNVTNYTNLSNPQTLYVRLESLTNGCVTTGFFDIRVELPPIPVQPTPLELCDDEIADEITVFDLTLKDTEITGGNASWSVSYYETDADAQSDTNVIDPATSYTNTAVGVNPANPQTLYVRVTDTDTDCYAFTTLTIRVLPNPTPSLDPLDLELCDDTNTGDAQEIFDLTLNQGYIINGEAGVSATYHESLEDAESGLNAIVDPTQYTNTSTPQTIWVRVTNDITGCYTLVTFDIIVHPLPDVIAVTDYIACEIGTDGFWDFDLESKTDEVLDGQDPLIFVVTYHETLADAQSGINALVSPYTNIVNPQQIFVNITNTLTGCDIATVSFNIEVQEGAQANSDGVVILYELCDDNVETDGDPTNDSVQFDLSVQDGAILDGQDPLNYTVSYYQTLADAELGVNPLPSLYENIINPQVIYARVDNDTTVDSICYAVTSLTLQVNPLPIFDLEDEYILCVDTNGTEIIDTPLLDTGLSQADYSFVWSLNGVEIGGATGSSLVPLEGGSYSVTVSDNITGCQSTDTAIVTESSPPVVTAIVTSLAFADNHVIEATVTGSGVYEYSLDDGPWQDSGTFTNVSAGEHVVKARDINGCGIGVTTVLVIDYPLYFTPNGDGYNDTWNITGIGTQPSAKIYIFDRYGKLLKQLSPTGAGWNGTYNGEPLPSNDYWFTIVFNEPSNAIRKEFRAHFTLKR